MKQRHGLRVFVDKFWEHLAKRVADLVVVAIFAIISLFVRHLGIKQRIIEAHAYGDVSFWLLIILVLAVVLMLAQIIRDYGRYHRFQRGFGIHWDKNYDPRCLSCNKFLKFGSEGKSILFCSDPKCDNKHVLRGEDGERISLKDAKAIMDHRSKG